MSIRIEQGQPRDGPAISTIMTDWIGQTWWMPRVHTQADYRDFGPWIIEVCEVFVAKVEDHIVGFLARQNNNIQALYVDQQSRGMGIGAVFLQKSKSSTDTLALWTFQANTGAHKFYRRHGFVENGRTDGQDNDEKLPDVHFVWTKETT